MKTNLKFQNNNKNMDFIEFAKINLDLYDFMV